MFLKENVPCGLGHWKAWSLVCGAVWGGLEGVTLLKQMCLWEPALKFQRPMLFPLHSLSACVAPQDVSSQLLQLSCRLLAASLLRHLSPQNCKPNK